MEYLRVKDDEGCRFRVLAWLGESRFAWGRNKEGKITKIRVDDMESERLNPAEGRRFTMAVLDLHDERCKIAEVSPRFFSELGKIQLNRRWRCFDPSRLEVQVSLETGTGPSPVSKRFRARVWRRGRLPAAQERKAMEFLAGLVQKTRGERHLLDTPNA